MNLSLDPGVVQPGLELVIHVLDTLPEYLGVPKRIPESGRLKVDVRQTPTFDLTAIPFPWTSDPDSSIIAVVDSMEDHPDHSHLLHSTRTLLPIGDMEVVAHRPVWSTNNNPVMLLLKTKAIRLMEGGDGYYMGTMTRTSGAIRGLAFIGAKSSFAVPDESVMAHGFGHNLSLLHAPCGGGAYSADPDYPHEGGVIGAWGWNSRGLVAPATLDLMGYCSPKWISDYHFTKAMNYRTAQAMAPKASPPLARSLLLWGGSREDGIPFLKPAFVLDAPPALAEKEGGYRIVGRDGEGGELFSLRFAMSVAAEGRGSGFAFTLPLRAGWEDRLSSITLVGPGGSATLDEYSEQPMAILRDRTTRQVHAILGGLPSATRTHTAAAELLSPGPEFTLRFSRGIPGKEAWRRARTQLTR